MKRVFGRTVTLDDGLVTVYYSPRDEGYKVVYRLDTDSWIEYFLTIHDTWEENNWGEGKFEGFPEDM